MEDSNYHTMYSSWAQPVWECDEFVAAMALMQADYGSERLIWTYPVQAA